MPLMQFFYASEIAVHVAYVVLIPPVFHGGRVLQKA